MTVGMLQAGGWVMLLLLQREGTANALQGARIWVTGGSARAADHNAWLRCAHHMIVGAYCMQAV